MLVALLVITALTPSQYEYPAEELARANGISRVSYLQKSEDLTIQYSWHDLSKQVKFRCRIGSNPSQKFSESVSFYMTAVAPKHYETLYVIGVRDNGRTVLQKWSLLLSADGKATVKRDPVLESDTLTHIRALAVSPNEDFAIAQHHETGTVFRIALPEGPVTPLLDTTDHADLHDFDQIIGARHVHKGYAFRLSAGRSGRVPAGKSDVILLWDTDLDGIPNSTERLSLTEYKARGYSDHRSWAPLNEFYQ